MTTEDKKREFMHREICALCFLASFGMARRVPFYKADADREAIRKYIRDELWELSIKYSRKIEENEHIKTIETFQNEVNKKFLGMLARSGLTFGRAQKLINLYLKYMWVCGFIKEPPHCPIDSIIIKELKKLSRKVPSTSFTNMNKTDYIGVISEIKGIKGKQSIAEWELQVFNRR
jgi:hypothetical protein